MVSETPYHLCKVPSDWVDYEIIAKTAMKFDNTVFSMIPKSRLSRELVNDAVSRYPAPSLYRIPREFRDYNTIEQAIRHCIPDSFLLPDQEIINTVPELPASAIQCRFWLYFVPDSKKTEENIEQYLKNYPDDIYKIPHHLLIKNRAWCENAVLVNNRALNNIPKEHLDYELCLLAISQNANAIEWIPETLVSEHPELLDKAIKSGVDPYRLGNLSSLITADDIHANPQLVTERPYSDKSLWATMIEAPAHIPCTLHTRVIEQQDTCHLQHLPITGLLSSSESLCQSLCKLSDPVRRDPYCQPVDPVFIELKKRLIRCKPLALPNATTGAVLQQYIVDHYQKTTKALANHSLPTSSIPTSAKVYGGRTLLSENPDKTGCDRYKFLRKDEPLDEFFREEAVHQFCNDTHEGKILTSQYLSEVPKSKGIVLVQKTETVSTIINQFTSQPEVITINNQDYYLVYHFHTRDKSYSDQANQPLENRNLTENIQALKNAAHSLGQWMSCGAVHTSTIQAFHNFSVHRRELFLIPLFSRSYPVAGCLSFWNTKATDQSDFVLSGLKDLGDMEFYPYIETYSTARNAQYFIPGYTQRCSFMEGFVSNMVAITLNYCRLLQTEADFHYSNQHAVSAMKVFITDITNQYLTGLFGTPTTAASLFPNDEVYHQWLNNTALETIYWTAEQSDDNDDCVFQHLKKRGELSREVYPDWQGKYYYRCTSESKAHSLGLSTGSFPLASLVKGLAQIACGMAEKLQPQPNSGLCFRLCQHSCRLS